ncbi:hypothetical protein PINS_up005030 [Pythium insidiosum]|nr:hypothetical protein PINS_up005030 [Pythium insidiosum]
MGRLSAASPPVAILSSRCTQQKEGERLSTTQRQQQVSDVSVVDDSVEEPDEQQQQQDQEEEEEQDPQREQSLRASSSSVRAAWPWSAMNHLIQVARRTGMHAVGYRVQLVLHRMNAQLPSSFHNVELCAVVTRHKKRVVTKGAAYQADKKEIVWGDILPFTCTLWMAKTGLFQAKVFTVQVYDTRNDQQIAAFEFNLAELVQSSQDACKEGLMVPALKCQDHRATLSLTVVSTKATARSKAPRSPGDPEISNADEVSFDGSDLSAITLDSKSSRTSMTSTSRYTRQQMTAGASTDDHKGGKTDGLRGAYPVSDNDAVELYNLRSKHVELLRTVENLEEQLRQCEGDNVKLEKRVEEKDALVAQLRREKEELEHQVEELQQRIQELERRAADGNEGREEEDGAARLRRDRQLSSASDMESMQVDFAKYMALKEERDKLEIELTQLKASQPPPVVMLATRDSVASTMLTSDASRPRLDTGEEDPDNDRTSEASSGNEYVDAHDPHLLAEIQELKQALEASRAERDRHEETAGALQTTNTELVAQLRDVEGKLEAQLAEGAQLRRRLEEQQELIDQSGELKEQQEEAERRRREIVEEAREENEKLLRQLSQLDAVVTTLKKEKEELVQKLQRAEASQSRAQQDVASANQAINELQGRNDGLSEKLSAAEQASDRAQRELESAQLTIDELREEVRELASKLQHTQTELDALRHGELASSAAAAAAAIAKNQELQERWDELNALNSQLQTRVDELEERLAQTEASGEEREAELQRAVATLREETAQLKEELEELRASKEKVEEELHQSALALQEAVEHQRRLTVDHSQQLDELKSQQDELEARTAGEVREKEAVEQELRKRVEGLEQENAYFQGELIDSKMKLAEMTAKNEELTSQFHRLEKALNDTKIKATAAEQALLATTKKK